MKEIYDNNRHEIGRYIIKKCSCKYAAYFFRKCSKGLSPGVMEFLCSIIFNTDGANEVEKALVKYLIFCVDHATINETKANIALNLFHSYFKDYKKLLNHISKFNESLIAYLYTEMFDFSMEELLELAYERFEKSYIFFMRVSEKYDIHIIDRNKYS